MSHYQPRFEGSALVVAVLIITGLIIGLATLICLFQVLNLN